MNITPSSDSSVELIVGLGNPGGEYERSRHNAGFMVIERLLAGFPAGRFEETRISESRLFSGRFRGRNLYLQMPLTYMNLSGNAVAGFCRKAQIQPERVLVVLDDMDLELGRIKLRNGGSAGGHHGLESVTATLGTCRIKRLRVGIGHPGSGKTVDYVLSGFEGDEERKFSAALDTAAEAVKMVLSAGMDRAMNKYNTRPEEQIADNNP
jgi:PTH1 family peptidyl-tRNA hydrolase